MREFARGNCIDDYDGFGFIWNQVLPIEHQEYVHRRQCYAFISVGKTMIARESEAVRSCEVEDRTVGLVSQILLRTR